MAIAARDRFLEAAQKELIEFERREREFSKKERKERAAELSIPALGSNFNQTSRGPTGQPSRAQPN